MGGGLRMAASTSSMECGSPRASPVQQQQQHMEHKRGSPVPAVASAAESRQPARDRTGARKALLQWAQNATKQ